MNNVNQKEQDVREALSFHLKRFRKKRRWNQEKMATKLGLKRATYAAYEEKRSQPSIQVFKTMTRLMGMSIYELTELAETV